MDKSMGGFMITNRHGTRVCHQAAKGTQEPSEGLRAERQQTEWTGHWLCICQQSGISLNPPPAAKRVRHHGHSQLSAGLLPFRFPGRPAAGCPLLSFKHGTYLVCFLTNSRQPLFSFKPVV